jgi:hypothetical protein
VYFARSATIVMLIKSINKPFLFHFWSSQSLVKCFLSFSYVMLYHVMRTLSDLRLRSLRQLATERSLRQLATERSLWQLATERSLRQRATERLASVVIL